MCQAPKPGKLIRGLDLPGYPDVAQQRQSQGLCEGKPANDDQLVRVQRQQVAPLQPVLGQHFRHETPDQPVGH